MNVYPSIALAIYVMDRKVEIHVQTIPNVMQVSLVCPLQPILSRQHAMLKRKFLNNVSQTTIVKLIKSVGTIQEQTLLRTIE